MQLFHRGSAGLLALLFTLCCAASPSAFAQRVVFAHFMLANQDYVASEAPSEAVIVSYQREIREAQAIGIDGFALNAGGWFKEPRYIKRASEMFEAAYRLNSGFKLTFSADMCCTNDAEDVEDMVRRFANSARYAGLYYRRNGRVLLTTFAGTKQGPEFWQQLRHDLEEGAHPSRRDAPDALSFVNGISSSKPLPIFFVPAFFWGGELPRQSDIQAGLASYAGIVDGAFYWGTAAVPGLGHSPDQIPSADAYASLLHGAGKLYMAPICFQFWGANAGRYYEYSGYSGMRKMWMDAILVNHPEAVEIVTWNDFVEGTYVSPIDDPASYAAANDLGASIAPPSTPHFFHTHRGATELLAYFIQWYKTGKEPALKTDSLYWAYRTVLSPEGKPQQLYGPVRRVIYLTANLTAAASLQVTIGDAKKVTITLPAGSTDAEVSLIPGSAPVFELTRGRNSVLHATGADPVTQADSYPNFYYSTGAAHARL